MRGRLVLAGVLALAAVVGKPAAAGAGDGRPPAALAPDEVVRLHIVAHSDDPFDQAAKYAVRDALLPLLRQLAEQAPGPAREGADAWLAYLKARRARIAEQATWALRQAGDTVHPVRVTFAIEAFAPSAGGPLELPAGHYRTVRVILGEGRGHNWWCVAFPLLCPAAAGDAGRARAERVQAAGRPDAAGGGSGRPETWPSGLLPQAPATAGWRLPPRDGEPVTQGAPLCPGRERAEPGVHRMDQGTPFEAGPSGGLPGGQAGERACTCGLPSSAPRTSSTPPTAESWERCMIWTSTWKAGASAP